MPKATRTSSRNTGSKPAKSSKKAATPKDAMAPLFKSKAKSFNIGGDVRYTRDLSRFVRWPKYVRVQRQRKVLKQRLKVPPSIEQFSNTMDKNQATELFRLLDNYRPETKAEKKVRLTALADKIAKGEDAKQGKPGPVIKFGVNHVTTLIEEKKAKLVIIAADVDPLELVMWMPALCRLQNVPYVFINSKARLGALVHQKNATCLALTEVNREHEASLQKMIDIGKAVASKRLSWGNNTMGLKTTRRLEKRAAEVAASEAKKAMVMV
jgi:large subunit ribosomal protein L7Ae